MSTVSSVILRATPVALCMEIVGGRSTPSWFRDIPYGVVSRGHPCVWLPKTPFVARSVLVRYGHRIDHVDPAVQVLSQIADRIDALPAIRVTDPLPEPFPPGRTSWWSHQRAAYWAVRRLWEAGAPGAAIFAPLRSGKTRIAIGLMDWLAYQLGAERYLVVAPQAALRDVWLAEIRRHSAMAYEIAVPDMSLRVQERVRLMELAAMRTQGERPVVMGINYEAVTSKQFLAWALRHTWDLIVCDELHRIKSAHGAQSLALFRVGQRARHRLGLTATPLHHRPTDIWAQYRFLDPGIWFCSWRDFERDYGHFRIDETGEVQPRDRAAEFRRRLFSIAFRPDQLDISLPRVDHVVRTCRLGSVAARLYRDLEERLVADVGAGRVTVSNILTRLTKLQEVTSGFVRDDSGSDHVIDSAKIDLLRDILQDFCPKDPLVVFAVFQHDQACIRRVAEDLGYTVAELTGRAKELDAWKAGQRSLLIVEPRIGGEALSLSRASTAIFYSSRFSLGEWEQAVGRIRGPEQDRRFVTCIHLVVSETVDERKQRYLQTRQDVVQGLMSDFEARARAGRRIQETPERDTPETNDPRN